MNIEVLWKLVSSNRWADFELQLQKSAVNFLEANFKNFSKIHNPLCEQGY